MKYSTMEPFQFLNYDMKLKGEIVNNGHSGNFFFCLRYTSSLSLIGCA